MADPYGDPFDIGDFLHRERIGLSVRSPLAQAKAVPVTEGVYVPPLERESGYYWPGWLCWLFGHEPIVHGRPTHAELRCLCGAEVATREKIYRLRGTTLNHPWQRFVGWLWRVLP